MSVALAPRSRKLRFVKDREVVRFLCLSLIAAVEHVRAEEGVPQGNIEIEGCRCGKCRALMDASTECRFFTRRDGLRMAGHKQCISLAEAVWVSPESALQIFRRQAAQG